VQDIDSRESCRPPESPLRAAMRDAVRPVSLEMAIARLDAVTASKTEADTSATTRLVTFGAVPAVRTVVFMTSITRARGLAW